MQNISVRKPLSPERHRTHYQDLDFLRGVAAVIVVLFHFSARLDLGGLFAHAYLAVDFFFALSGFVIDHAYRQPMTNAQLTLRSFFLLRVIRLLPLVVLGTTVAAVIDLFRHGNFSELHHVFDVVIVAIFEYLLLPVFWKTTLEQTTYPLNGPVWSLFFEMFANLGHGFILKFKNNHLIFIVLAITSLAILTFSIAHSDSIVFGTFDSTFLLGFPRALWPYCLGVLLSRADIHIKPINKWFYAAALLCLLACPVLPAQLNGLYDLCFVCFAVPFIVLGAAHGTNPERRSSLAKWSGDLSYPLYTMHYSLVRVVAAVSRQFAPSAALSFLIAVVAAASFAVISLFVYKLYDVPLRRWLTERIAGYRFRHAVRMLPARNQIS